MKKSRIISYTSRNDACFWYRNKMPLDALAKKGWTTSNIIMGDMMDHSNVDIIQFSRVYTTQFEELVYMLKDRGVKIWYDVDDAVDLVKLFNPFAVPNRQHMSAFYFLLNEADFITTTCPNLQKHLQQKTPKPVNIFGNYINPSEWSLRAGRADSDSTAGLRVGFAGSPSHIKEINMILPVVKELQKRYGFMFVVLGMGTGDSLETWYAESKKQYGHIWETWEYTKEVEIFYNLLKDIYHEWHAAKRWEMYPKLLAKLNLDIGLCPLLEDDFNVCKSAIKLYEYAMVGTVALASNVTPFKEEALAVTENTPEAWTEALDALLMHKDLRESTHKAQREYVLKNRVVDDNIHILEDILAPYGKKE